MFTQFGFYDLEKNFYHPSVRKRTRRDIDVFVANPDCTYAISKYVNITWHLHVVTVFPIRPNN